MAKRERRKLDDKELAQLEAMAAIRLPIGHMAAIFNISKTTLDRIFKKQDAARDALENGKAKGASKVMTTAFSMATSGQNPNMTMFWLKTQERWRETDRLEIVDDTTEDRKLTDLSPEERAERIAYYERLLKK